MVMTASNALHASSAAFQLRRYVVGTCTSLRYRRRTARPLILADLGNAQANEARQMLAGISGQIQDIRNLCGELVLLGRLADSKGKARRTDDEEGLHSIELVRGLPFFTHQIIG